MRKVLHSISILLMLIGFVGFVGGGLIAKHVFSFNREVPLSGVNGLLVDKDGKVYLALTSYGKVQVYGGDGRFLYNWPVDASGGTFQMQFDEQENIIISTSRRNKLIRYNKQGKRLSESTYEKQSPMSIEDPFLFERNPGEVYKVEGLFPKVVRHSKEKEVIVDQSLFLKGLKSPLPVWLYFAVGLIIQLYLKKGLRRSRGG